MAKDTRDTATTDAFGVPGKRGRKATGAAKTAAERQAAYRQRKAAQSARPALLVEDLKRELAASRREIDLLIRERATAHQAVAALKQENELLRRTLAISKS